MFPRATRAIRQKRAAAKIEPDLRGVFIKMSPHFNIDDIPASVVRSAEELFARRAPRSGELIVLGCSSSAIIGKPLGSSSSDEAGRAVVESLLKVCVSDGLVLAVQGCEHINRALVVPASYAEERELVQVNVIPINGAGGAAASAYFALLGADGVVVENLGRGADYGLDIGGVLIGMHLRRDRVAVPVHIPYCIGFASVNGAFCRLKWVGGPRTRFAD